MNMMEKNNYNSFYNILTFTSIFLSGDLNLLKESNTYIIEKFEKFFGNISVKKNIVLSPITKEHEQLWKYDDYRINSIFLYLFEVLSHSNKNDWLNYVDGVANISIDPNSILKLFNHYIGYLDKDELKIGLVHQNIKELMVDSYIEQSNLEHNFFKSLKRLIKFESIGKKYKPLKHKEKYLVSNGRNIISVDSYPDKFIGNMLFGFEDAEKLSNFYNKNTNKNHMMISFEFDNLMDFLKIKEYKRNV